jgi:distribution and morphology protein 12
MSIDVNWPADPQLLNEQITRFLNEHCAQLPLPDFLQHIHVKNFSMGTVGPSITIRHISDPFEEFYEAGEDDDQEGDDEQPAAAAEPTPAPAPNDTQLLVEVDYKGDVSLEIEIELLINFPSPEFIKLPVSLKIVELAIHSLLVVAYLSRVRQCFVSFLCDLSDDTLDDVLQNPRLSKDKTTRIDIIRNLRIENEIGELKTTTGPGSGSGSTDLDQGAILRNVDKVERFLTDLIRDLLRDELAWPGWIQLDFD